VVVVVVVVIAFIIIIIIIMIVIIVIVLGNGVAVASPAVICGASAPGGCHVRDPQTFRVILHPSRRF